MSTRGKVTVVAITAGLVAAALELAAGAPAFAARSISAAAETATALVGLSVTALFTVRLRRTRSRRDLGLLLAFALLTASAALWAAIPHALELDQGGVAGWASGACHVAAALCIVAALTAGPRPVSRLALPTAIAFAVALELAAVAGSMLVAPGVAPPTEVLAVVRMGLAATFALLAFDAARRADRGGTVLDRGLALASGLAACAYLYSGAHASLALAGVGMGDLLRLAAFTVMLQAAVRDLAAHWSALAGEAVADERRRLARDLHDGMAQELAAVLRCVQATAPADGRAREAAERALHDARAAIGTLRDAGDPQPTGDSLASAITRAVQDAARRTGAEVTLTIAPGLRASPEDREELPRIVGQAVDNAALHGRAGRIVVDLCDDHGLRVTVRDDGCGFSGSSAAGHYGLRGMTERATRAGRALRVRSTPGSGTTVEVHPR